jgi:2-methylisocitrate lyase-like PEP mutase family enzyme
LLTSTNRLKGNPGVIEIMSYGDELRETILSDEILVAPGVHDALTGRVVDKLGAFDAVLATGSGGNISRLGLPDAGLATMHEMIEHAESVQEAVDVPVIADADNGYGNATNMIRTTREFIKAGVAGFVFEDQAAPKRNGNVKGKRVLSREEAVGKVQAAVDTRDDHDESFVIIARTGARGAVGGSLDEAIERANAFAEIGADATFVQGPASREEAERIGSEVDGPSVYVGTGVAPRLQPEEAQELGFDTQWYGRLLTYAAVLGIRESAEELRDKGTDALHAVEDDFFDEYGSLHDFAGMDEILAQEAKYLPDDQQSDAEETLGYEVGTD